jgi:hypothetical protein
MWRVLALLSDEARSLTGGGLERVVAQYWGGEDAGDVCTANRRGSRTQLEYEWTYTTARSTREQSTARTRVVS